MEVGSAWLSVVMMRERRMGRRVAAERSALQAVTPLTEGFCADVDAVEVVGRES